MNTLGLDLSSKSSGWSIFNNGEYLQSGVIKATSTDLIKRIEKITNEVKNILDKNKIDIIIIEEVLPNIGHNNNPNVWKALTWLQASIMFMLHTYYPKVKVEFFLPNVWRCNIGINKTGLNSDRRATLKELSVQLVKNKYGLEVNDDEADSININYAYNYKNSNEINWE